MTFDHLKNNNGNLCIVYKEYRYSSSQTLLVTTTGGGSLDDELAEDKDAMVEREIILAPPQI
jgi:hypothetical protein